ncbi:MAG: chromate efflux transporter [Dehalococcoidia bacterium]
MVRLFLRLGVTAYGGPAAHIAMMHDEVVVRRRWLTDQHFLDLVGATNLIPGPNSTEMAIHIGFARGRVAGLVLAGLCFIIPAALITLAFAWAYVEYGTTPAAGWLLYGVKPVVIAVILQAVWALGRRALGGMVTGAAGTAVVAGYLLGFNEIALLLLGGLFVMLVKNRRRVASWRPFVLAPPFALAGLPLQAADAQPTSLWLVFLLFLKVGSILYGSGYVLLAFLRADFVERLGWMTDEQLVDAIAIGQLTPGPVFTTATFVGYYVEGLPGALVATVGIFVPSFLFVGLLTPIVPRLRRSTWTAAALDGVNAASLGLMAAVMLQLGRASLVDVPTVLVAGASAVLLLRYRVNSTWLILGGALAGIATNGGKWWW